MAQIIRSIKFLGLACLFILGMGGAKAAVSSQGLEISLAQADLTFWCEDIGDWSGYSVSPAGDVNQDGYDDILIGAPYAGVGGPKGAGEAYLILGRPRDQWLTNHIDLQDVEPSFAGLKRTSMVGRQNYTAGDVNGDGYDDFLVSCWKCNSQKGKAYLFLGRPNIDWGKDYPVDNADASFIGEMKLDRAGWYVSTAGDVNADGYDDFLIAAVGDEDTGGGHNGKVYLILGRQAADWGLNVNLINADASFTGEAYGDVAGRSATGVGDVNGDGYDDFLIGALYSDDGGIDAGEAYLILGRAAADWGRGYPLAEADASFAGEDPGDQLGRRVAGAGDVNNDGYMDLLFGASYNDQTALDAGKAYLILGRPQVDWGADFPIELADASFMGENSPDQAGRRVSGLGDVNQDGYADFIVGAPHNNRGGVEGGSAYLFFGQATADWGVNLPLSQADLIYTAEDTYDHAGFDIAPAGDMDGDGIDDFLIGAWNGNEHGSQCGQSYILYGGVTPKPFQFLPDTPEGRVGEWHSFITSYWDPTGWEDIASAQIIIGRTETDLKALNAIYKKSEGAIYLRNRDGTDWIGPCSPGDQVILGNGTVELDCQLTTVNNDGALSLSLSWQARWVQPAIRQVVLISYLAAEDLSGNDSGLLELGSWTLLP